MDHKPAGYFKAGLLVLAILNFASPASSQWPVFQHDFERTGHSGEYSEFQEMDLVLFWNYSVNDSILSSPAVADLDLDGFEEVVFGSDNGGVYVLDYKGNLLWSYMTGGPVRSAPAVGNLSLGEGLQVVVGSNDGSLYAFNYKGDLLWRFKTDGYVTSSALITDIVNGPKPGVVFASWDGRLYVLYNDGEEFWSYDLRSPIVFPLALADVDVNGVDDFVFVSGDTVQVLSLFPFKVIITHVGSEVTTAPVIDGNEIILGSLNGVVHRFTRNIVGVNESVIATGPDRWHWVNRSRVLEVLEGSQIANCTKAIYSTPAFANLDGDEHGRIEYVYGCDDGNMYILGYAYTNATRLFRYTTSKPVRSSPALVDLHNDSLIEVVFGNDDGNVYVLNSSGFGLWNTYLGGKITASPAVSDLDDDLYAEIIFASTEGNVYCFGSNSSLIKSLGKAYYDTAYDLLNLKEFDNATDYGLKALETYEAINYSDGVDDVNVLFFDISAKEHCVKAVDFYDNGFFEQSIEEIQLADMIYFNAGHGVKSECNHLLTTAYANFHYEKGLALVDMGFFAEAKAHAEQASNLSIRSVDSAMSVQSFLLLNRIFALETARNLFDEAFDGYEKNESPGEILSRLEESERLYEENNVSMEIYRPVRDEIYLMRSELYFRNLTALLNESRFEVAYDLAVDIKNLCFEVNYTDCVERSEGIVEKTKVHVEAKGLLDQARKYYTAADFRTSSEFARKAADAYTLAGDEEKAGEALEILNKSLTTLEKVSTGRSWTEELSNPVVIVIILQVAVAVVIIVTRPKARALFRGFMGLGRMVPASGLAYAGVGWNFWKDYGGRRRRR